MGEMHSLDGKKRLAYKISVGKHIKWPYERLRRRWKGNMKMDIKEVGYKDKKWMELAQNCI
jgi:hypothetical protein